MVLIVSQGNLSREQIKSHSTQTFNQSHVSTLFILYFLQVLVHTKYTNKLITSYLPLLWTPHTCLHDQMNDLEFVWRVVDNIN